MTAIDDPVSTDDSLERLGEQLRALAHDVEGPLRRVRLSSGDLVVEVEWEHPTPAPVTVLGAPAAGYPAAPPAFDVVAATAAVPPAPAAATVEAVVAAPDDGGVDVASPMVGTFYHCPGPGEPPFVEVGQSVEAGQTIGIVEAMKLLNPIEADVAGVVLGVAVGDGEPVEFAQPLVRIRPRTAVEG